MNLSIPFSTSAWTRTKNADFGDQNDAISPQTYFVVSDGLEPPTLASSGRRSMKPFAHSVEFESTTNR